MNSQQLAAFADLTFRQVDHWTRRGWLQAKYNGSGSGVPRDYAPGEALVAATMSRLVRAGLTVPAAHQVARGQSELAPGVLVVVGEVA